LSDRPAVDVVVPYAGSELTALADRLRPLRLRAGDTLTIALNATLKGSDPLRVAVVDASDRRGSYHARNVGAKDGTAPWLLFIDADVEPAPDLLDRLFEPMPRAATGVLAGAVIDEPPPEGERGPAALRYAWLKSSMSQEHTLGHEGAAFAQTANCAVRRQAFADVGGFADEVRSGGDADLCFRLAAAGWELETRPSAAVLHRNRQTIPRMLAQRARHGAGAAWLGKRHPGVLPPRRVLGVAWWGARRFGSGLAALLRGDRDAALLGFLDGPAVLAFELGRRIPNRRLLQPRRRR
jgi:GT2 family glycosyltransferase